MGQIFSRIPSLKFSIRSKCCSSQTNENINIEKNKNNIERYNDKIEYNYNGKPNHGIDSRKTKNERNGV